MILLGVSELFQFEVLDGPFVFLSFEPGMVKMIYSSLFECWS